MVGLQQQAKLAHLAAAPRSIGPRINSSMRSIASFFKSARPMWPGFIGRLDMQQQEIRVLQRLETVARLCAA